MAEKKQWHETLHDQFGQYFAEITFCIMKRPITRI